VVEVRDPVDFAREVRDFAAREYLPGPCDAAQPGSEVQRAAAKTAVDRHCLAGVQTNTDGERKSRIGDCVLDELQL
jgi:hypothetical protein